MTDHNLQKELYVYDARTTQTDATSAAVTASL